MKRRVAVVPGVEVPAVSGKVEMTGDGGWSDAAQGDAFAWEVVGDDLQERNPEWEMVADGERVFVRVRVEDGVKSYWPKMGLDWKWGGLASDAVSVAWGEGKGVKRVWVLPFGPKGGELWTNEGVGPEQSALMKLDEKLGVTAAMDSRGWLYGDDEFSAHDDFRRGGGGENEY